MCDIFKGYYDIKSEALRGGKTEYLKPVDYLWKYSQLSSEELI